MVLVWDDAAWKDYLWWQTEDRRTLKRTNQLIRDIARNGNERIGKPKAQTRPCRLLVTPHHRRTPPGLQNRRQRDPHRQLPIPLRDIITEPPPHPRDENTTVAAPERAATVITMMHQIPAYAGTGGDGGN